VAVLSIAPSPGRPDITPRTTCGTCTEYLPHYCAAAITITWPQGAGRPRVIIVDRAPRPLLTPAGAA
jgi:hypothetical protein